MNPTAAEKLEVRDYDAADYLQNDADVAAYVQAVFDEDPDDPHLLLEALGSVIRAQRRMTDVARRTAMSRQGLYEALSPEGNPSIGTVIKVIASLGLRLSVSVRGSSTGKASA